MAWSSTWCLGTSPGSSGAYVAVFALVSILIGRFWFREAVPATTWAGLGLIVLGGLVIQIGGR